jgi:hypothetical protein
MSLCDENVQLTQSKDQLTNDRGRLEDDNRQLRSDNNSQSKALEQQVRVNSYLRRNVYFVSAVRSHRIETYYLSVDYLYRPVELH